MNLVLATRKWEGVQYGASPRATIGLILSAKARAFLQGRNYVSKEDLHVMAYPVLRHRIILGFEAERKGLTRDQVVTDILKSQSSEECLQSASGQIMDTEFFKELEKFSLLVKKRVSTAYSGGRKSLRFGHGISPVGYREYRKGDDFKLVDWKVYGRTEKLYIREHEEERSLVVHILLDGSASMGYEGKFAYASRLAAGFAYLATLENEKYAISLFCNKLYPAEPKRGRRNLFQTIGQLDEIAPRGGTSLLAIADQLEPLLKTTSLVVLISDLLGETDDVFPASTGCPGMSWW